MPDWVEGLDSHMAERKINYVRWNIPEEAVFPPFPEHLNLPVDFAQSLYLQNDTVKLNLARLDPDLYGRGRFQPRQTPVCQLVMSPSALINLYLFLGRKVESIASRSQDFRQILEETRAAVKVEEEKDAETKAQKDG